MATRNLDRPDPAAPGTAVAALDDRREEPVAFAQVVRIVAAATSLGAATVHASAISQHTFDALHASTFVAMTVFQAWWAYLVLRSTEGRVLVAGAVGHGSILLLWMISRMSGLPSWLPGAAGREPVGIKDLAATVLAVTALIAVDLLSRRDVVARSVRASRAGAAVGAFVIAAVVVAAAGSVSTGHVHGHTVGPAGAAHDH